MNYKNKYLKYKKKYLDLLKDKEQIGGVLGIGNISWGLARKLTLLVRAFANCLHF